jgi:hypothetical protein
MNGIQASVLLFVMSIWIFPGIATGQIVDRGAVSSGRIKAPEHLDVPGSRSHFNLFFGVGAQASGDLFRLSNTMSIPRSWEASTGSSFSADRYKASLGEDMQLALGFSLRAGPVALRMGFERAEVGVFALARTGGTVVSVPFDRIVFSTYGAELILELAEGRMIPYLIGGYAYTVTEGLTDLYDQDVFGIRFGGGLSYAIMQNARLAFEVVDTRADINSNAIQSSLSDGTTEFLGYGPQHLFGIRAVLVIEI